jgi:hypothetical protein
MKMARDPDDRDGLVLQAWQESNRLGPNSSIDKCESRAEREDGGEQKQSQFTIVDGQLTIDKWKSGAEREGVYQDFFGSDAFGAKSAIPKRSPEY